MKNKLDLTINSSRVYADINKIEESKQEFEEMLQSMYSNKNIQKEEKGEEALYRGRYEETCKLVYNDINIAITELQNAVNISKFTPSQDMKDTIDFVETMKAGEYLSLRVLDEQISKYKGQKMNLIYLREKLKDIVGIEPFEKYTFSTYTVSDIDKKAQFVPPDNYFNQIRKSVEEGNNAMTTYLMNGLEDCLGIELSEGKKYKEKVLLIINDTTIKLI